jgi:hypothetical protein
MVNKIQKLISKFDDNLLDKNDSFEVYMEKFAKLIIEDVMYVVNDELQYQIGFGMTKTINDEVKKHYEINEWFQNQFN